MIKRISRTDAIRAKATVLNYEFKNEDVLCQNCQTVIGKTLSCKKSRCHDCERKERLKGIACPCCKSANIEEGGVYESNGVCGPGYHSWNKFPHLSCNDCGVIFKKIKT